jgi:nitrate/TMAO reductase-like tetraheme cytochrome c subunit
MTKEGHKITIFSFFLFLFLLSSGIFKESCAQIPNQDCLTCHSDSALSQELPDGATQSLFVDENILKKSLHRDNQCTDCHQGIEELPHPETLKAPSCSGCHSDVASVLAKGLHNKIKGACFNCHGSHNVLSSKDPVSPTYKTNQEKLCLSCHKDREDKSFTKYHHSQVVFPGGAKGKVSCDQCHEAHLPTLPDPQMVCSKCHPDILTDQKMGVHTQISCNNCHKEHKVFLGEEDKLAKLSGEISQCGTCHSKETEDFFGGVHGKELEKKNADVPSCISCHGAHKILPGKDPESSTFHNKIIPLCVSCHEDEKITSRHEKMPPSIVLKEFENSVHGLAVKRGLLVAPNCVDCHGYHKLTPADDPQSPVNKVNIPSTCGKCHPKIETAYQESIHGKALAQGIKDSPTCTDCHGEHNITTPTDTLSKVYPRNIPKTCSACHAEETLTSKYGLSNLVYETYQESFHGIANKYGLLTVANCASCHGSHDILPSTDPRSTISPNNIAQTCRKCHKNSSQNFAQGKIHIQPSQKSSWGVYITKKFYPWLIAILFFIFLIYTLFDLLGMRKVS